MNKKMSRSEAAVAIGCSEKALVSWLKAMDMFEACTRCYGTGYYGPQNVDAGRCFSCSGTGKVMPKLTEKVIDIAIAKVAAGAMVPHLKRWEEAKEARLKIRPIMDKMYEMYLVIGDQYSAVSRTIRDHKNIPEALTIAQTLNNEIFYGTEGRCGNIQGVRSILDDVIAGKISSVKGLKLVQEREWMLNCLVSAWKSRSDV